MEYCERIDAGFWAEPVNALTNLAFLLAAWLIARRLSRGAKSFTAAWDLWLLVLLMAAVGLGSFLWHTLATPWAQWADVIPILLFISLYLLSFLARVAGLGMIGVLAWFLLYQAFNYGLQAQFPPDFLNGSIFYLPTWASLLLMALYCRRAGRPGQGLLSAAALVFTVSLTLRTLDAALCPAWPLGTHFGWHLLNGLTLYLVMRVLLPSDDPAVRTSEAVA